MPADGPPPVTWTFPARCVRVVDGDTLDILLDQGLHVQRTERVRLLGVNTPEVFGATRGVGLLATAYVNAWIAAAGSDPWPLVVQTVKADSFGRYLMRAWRVSDGASLNADLLTSGHAVPYKEA